MFAIIATTTKFLTCITSDTGINLQQQTQQGAVEFPEGDAFLDFESPVFDQAEFRELYDGPKTEDEVFGSPSKPVVFRIASDGHGDVDHYVIRNPGADFLDPLFSRYNSNLQVWSCC